MSTFRALSLAWIACLAWQSVVWLAPAGAQQESPRHDAPKSGDAPPDALQTDDSQPAEQARRAAMARRVDELLTQRWSTEGVQPAAVASDAEFLRRAYLDLTGAIPRVSEARQFLADSAPDKRARLIDRLLDSPAHPTHLANTWRGFMLPPNVDIAQQNNVVGVQRWLRNQFADNLRYDRMVGDLLVATGGGDTGPALFYTALEVQPEKLAATTSRIFLGLQIDCAQCHDHPFDRWTQRDFWGYAAFFAQLRQPDSPDAVTAVSLQDLNQGEVKLPDSDEVVPPKYPGGATVDPDARGTRRQQLTIWLASRDNPYLARAAVNRVWALLFGRGLVEPVDDLGPHNPPSHPELMQELSLYLVDIGFDLRELLRTLANTRAYQLSSRWEGDDLPAEELLARMPVKTLSAEQLYDSLARLLLLPPAAMATNPQQSSSRLLDPRRQAFIARMQTPSRKATEYETGVPQALTMMNGTEMIAATDSRESGLLTALDSPLFDDMQRVETLFLATLTRLPRDEESSKFVEYIASGGVTGDRRRALGDCLWALLNSAEFALNH